MRALVTGAQGWLGRYLCAALRDAGAAAVLGLGRSPATDHFTHDLGAFGPAPLPGDLRRALAAPGQDYRSCDLLDSGALATVIREFAPSHVFHLAGAIPGQTRTVLEKLNAGGTESLVTALRAAGQPVHLVHVSSGAVYGEPAYLPIDEAHPLGPVTDYGHTKRAAEEVATRLSRGSDVTLSMARVFNVVGPGCPTSLLPGSLAVQLAAAAQGLGPRRVAMGPLQAVRDYIDVRDCARALLHLAQAGAALCNVASGEGNRAEAIWTGLRDCALASGAAPVETETKGPFAGNVSGQIADISRLRATGYAPGIGLDQSLRDLYRWAFEALDGTLGAAPR